MGAKTTNRINVTFFTDPLCCWSWAMEPQLRKFRFHFRDYVTWETKLGGLIPSWDNFHDESNAVSRPAQMGPVWFHAQKVSGMPMAHQMWAVDPPSSSFPSCIAVKCVMTQSSAAGEYYLRMLREACMIKGANIANKIVLLEIAGRVTLMEPSFDLELFQRDLFSSKGQQLFNVDWQETKQWEITRFPTLIMKYNGQTIKMAGLKSFVSLYRAITTLRPDLHELTFSSNLSEYSQYWNGLLEEEEREFLSEFIQVEN